MEIQTPNKGKQDIFAWQQFIQYVIAKETIKAREVNNFDVLRIVFAWFVVVSHSYFLNNASISDPLGWATNNYLIFSYLGVKGFFIISGYLIFQSLIRSRSMIEYLTKRILRIFPGLIVAVFISLLATYFVYPKKDVPYFLDQEIYSYFLDNILLFVSHFDIPGVFENMRSTAVNGSLWTIKFEFLCYLMLLLLFPLKGKKSALAVFTGVLLLSLLVLQLFFSDWLHKINRPIQMDLMAELASYFLAGSFLASLDRQSIAYKQLILFTCSALILVAIFLSMDRLILIAPLGFVIIWLGKRKSSLATWIHKTIGDPSYGMYLYAFPLQQFTIYFLKPTTAVLLITSSVLSLLLGIISWHLVEKKALMLKRYFLKEEKK
jgi:peptidoglycan/LPS O-acetylase OafA/YrhL